MSIAATGWQDLAACRTADPDLFFAPGENERWQDFARCAETDPEAFFPAEGASQKYAKAVCAGCEVRAECLEFAMENGVRFGIWGGLNERERQNERKRRNRRAA